MTQVFVDGLNQSLQRIREHELEEARSLQRAMLPCEPLPAGPVEVASQFQPVTEVGGDFLDFFHLSDRTMGLYLGDVVGKGLPAALYAALAVGTLRGIHKTGTPPAAVLGLLNRRLRMRAMPKRHCVVQYAVFDPATRLLHYANAGLPGPLHVSGRRCSELSLGGLPVGMFDHSEYEEQAIELEPGDAIVFFTDGLTDARNPAGEEFGVEQLVEICARNAHRPPEALLDCVFSALDVFVGDYSQHDDITAAVLKVTA